MRTLYVTEVITLDGAIDTPGVGDKHELQLAESESYGNGVQKLVYDVVR